MFGKKKSAPGAKPKLDDNAKAAVMATAGFDGSGGGGKTGAGAGASASGTQAAAAGGAQLLNQALERYSVRMKRFCKAGAILAGIGIVILLVGALLVHFFKGHLSSNTWKRIPGIFGIVFLLLSLLMLGIAILLLVCAYHLMKNRDRDSASPCVNLQPPQPGSLPDTAYPKQEVPKQKGAGDASAPDDESAPLRATEEAEAEATA
ncbi:hypothetical protein BOX15_Mlig021494g2 [Macrostomum lignano]|uniref:Uncharacterized protein n=3 Tax=Macrostomum lignano TaxID=282301 RepID=A0A267FHS5_9PLAT|nr:hypothetical protein BOX15_Mlig019997g2 [Macrostomum lignano]PAA73345.1 hypothetical protein BOX15_Mlig004365g2 [Macrostomum lignano]PAA79931.1 hypothetical protein BOX15_Mlig021494g2 [Macrostomum lignano]